MSRASNSELDALHALVAKELARKLKSGDYTAADLNVARAFLKDNGIEAMAVPGSPLAGLAASLPFAGKSVEQDGYNSH